jgi:hypothetical protein
MADELLDVWRKAIDVNARYYKALGTAADAWLSELRDLGRGMQPTIRVPRITNTPSAGTRGEDGGSARTSGSDVRPIVVLEAAEGELVTAAVLVENHLPEPVNATVEADAFVDAAGRVVSVDIDVQPQTIDLAPGESAIVRVQAVGTADAGPYRSALRVPRLPGTEVPLVLRSRAKKWQQAPTDR